jgi:hypothetical protein
MSKRSDFFCPARLHSGNGEVVRSEAATRLKKTEAPGSEKWNPKTETEIFHFLSDF